MLLLFLHEPSDGFGINIYKLQRPFLSTENVSIFQNKAKTFPYFHNYKRESL